jgi:hypothetical protein
LVCVLAWMFLFITQAARSAARDLGARRCPSSRAADVNASGRAAFAIRLG